MNEQVQQLELTAGHCMQLALTCHNAHARKVMRLLAADLMLAADEQRRAKAGASLDEELAELIRSSHPTADAG
jgi:hypothetical protein